jgi:hypothetical protein
MENPPGNKDRHPETGIEKIVSKWMDQYAPKLNRHPEVERKLQELTVNYMSSLLVKADKIAEFKRDENIQDCHVSSAIHSLDVARGVIKGRVFCCLGSYKEGSVLYFYEVSIEMLMLQRLCIFG